MAPARKRRLIRVGLALLCAGGVALLMGHTRGPTYAGRSLEFWFKRCCQSHLTGNRQEVNTRALIAMGDAAVPYLVDHAFDFRSGRLRQIQTQLFWGTEPRNIQRSAEAFLRMLRPSFEVLSPPLLSRLASGDVRQRREAIMLLGYTGEEASKAVPYLLAALDDSDSVMRVLAMQSLKDLGAVTREALPQIVKGLEEPALRTYAMEALGQIGSEAQGAVPALIVLLNGTNTFQRLVAAAAIRRIQPDHQESLEFLITTARSDSGSDRERVNAVRFLSELPPGDKLLVEPVLLHCLAETNMMITSYALISLERIKTDPSQVIQILAEGLKATDDLTRCNAANRILYIDAGHEESLKTLVELVRGRGLVAQYAIQTLGALGLKESVPALVEASQDANRSLRRAAKKSLETIALSEKEKKNRKP